MRNLIFLVLFLALVSTLIWWLWLGQSEEKTLEQAVKTQQIAEPTPELPAINLDEVEIAYDENGLVIGKLYNQEVNLVLSEKPVRNVEVFDGIMTYEEQSGNVWNFRSYNLAQYIKANLKAE